MTRRLPSKEGRRLAALLLLPLAFLLCHCGATTVIHPNGTLIAQEGILDEADGTIFEVTMPNGTKVTRIASHPNRTRVASGYFGLKKALGLGGYLRDERVNASNNKTREALGAQDVQKNRDTLKAEGKATSEHLSSGGESLPIQVKTPGS